MFFSIVIPTYEMNGSGVDFLKHNFLILKNQTFKDFNILISDHSVNKDIEILCQHFKDELNIVYLKNEKNRGNSSSNLNNGLKNADGQYIKIIFQDDFLYTEKSLQELHDHIINNNNFWYITSCQHSADGINFHHEHSPYWNNSMQYGNNTFSSPSTLTIKNIDNKMYFNEQLIWLMDVEYYKKMYDLFGEPSYLRKINVVNRVWGGSVSNTLSSERKNAEIKLMTERYS